jgi:gluconokinase
VIAIEEPTRPDEENAKLYARMRPLIEQSALAVADIVAELDKLAPEPLPDTEKALTDRSH